MDETGTWNVTLLYHCHQISYLYTTILEDFLDYYLLSLYYHQIYLDNIMNTST